MEGGGSQKSRECGNKLQSATGNKRGRCETNRHPKTQEASREPAKRLMGRVPGAKGQSIGGNFYTLIPSSRASKKVDSLKNGVKGPKSDDSPEACSLYLTLRLTGADGTDVIEKPKRKALYLVTGYVTKEKEDFSEKKETKLFIGGGPQPQEGALVEREIINVRKNRNETS